MTNPAPKPSPGKRLRTLIEAPSSPSQLNDIVGTAEIAVLEHRFLTLEQLENKYGSGRKSSIVPGAKPATSKRTNIASLIAATVCAGTALAEPAASIPAIGPAAFWCVSWNTSRVTTGGIAEPNAHARCAGEPLASDPGYRPSLPPAATKAPSSASPPTVYSGRYVGCFADRELRDLDGPHALKASPQACITYCAEQEFRFASMQNGNHCFCGNSYGRYGASNACVPCAGTPDESCGSSWANAVWELSGPRYRLPLPPNLLPPTKPPARPPAN